MNSESTKTETNAIRALYEGLITCWNNHKADDYAALFIGDGHIVGFDGSVIDGQTEIQSHLSGIFTDHVTAAYIGKIREISFLTEDSALLRAVVGMIPPGQSDINPATNAIQSMVAVKQEGRWRIALFHNTPAQFHGRPDLAQALTAELRELLK